MNESLPSSKRQAKSQATQRSLLARSLGPPRAGGGYGVFLWEAQLSRPFPARPVCSVSQTPSHPGFPRGAGPGFWPGSRGRCCCAPRAPRRGGAGCGEGARPGHAQSAGPGAAAVGGGGGSGRRRRRRALGPGRSCAVLSQLRQDSGARPCPQVAGSRARRRLLLRAAPRACPAAVAGSRTLTPRHHPQM